MRILAFEKDGGSVLGVHQGDTVIDLSVADPSLPTELVDLVKMGDAGLAAAKKAADGAPASAKLALGDIKHAILTTKASKYICLGLNYADHAAEGGHNRPEYPSFFMRGPHSLTAHNAPIIRPQCCDQLDYEAELVAIVGKRAKHVKQADALDYIWGYSICNEGSIRAYQRKTAQWTIGKNFDQTGGFGPEAVTADELPPGADGLRIQSRLNGTVMQDATTDMMLWGVAETVEILTECLTLEPGDILIMGTPAGVGHARKPPVWMKDGDTCEIEIEQIGVLVNPIKDEVLP
jgi:acylpyruvate hydrolase